MKQLCSRALLALAFIISAGSGYGQTESLDKMLDRDDLPAFTASSFEEDTVLLHKSVTAGAERITKHILSTSSGGTDRYNAEGLTPLHLATQSQNAAIVALLLEHGANPDTPDLQRLRATPLMHAVGFQDTQITRLLLQAGADVNATDVNGDPALNWAAYSGHIDQMQLLIEYGADLTMESKHGDAVDVALRLWHADSVIGFFRTTAFSKQLTKPDKRMLKAVTDGNREDVAQLIQSGADPDMTDGLGVPILQIAAQKGDMALVELLLKHGAQPDQLNRTGQSPLAFAARFDHRDVVQLMLKFGADVNTTDTLYRLTPLIGAAAGGGVETGRMLLKAGAEIDHTEPINQCSALHWSLFYSNTAFAEMLLQEGADFSLKVLDNRYTARSLAGFYGNEQVIHLIDQLEWGSNPLSGSWRFSEIHYVYQDTTYSIYDAQPGRLLVGPHHYTIMYTPGRTNRQPFRSLSKPTDEEIREAFQSIVFNTGSYERSDSLFVTTADIARVPGFEGGRQYYKYQVNGRKLNLRMIDETYPDGTKPAWYKKLEILFILTKE